LTSPTNCVALESWRQELRRRDVIESADKNPRATFKRIKDRMVTKGRQLSAEVVEGRASPKGNSR
jgi:hypothetical protein